MNLNLDKIYDIVATSNIPDWDKELVAAAVDTAIKVWILGPDKILPVLYSELSGDDPAPFKIDGVFRLPTGMIKVVDWKTKKAGKLDDRWVLRETRSWQPRIYAACIAVKFGADATFPLAYEVRGITLEEKPQTKTLAFVLTRADAMSAVHYLKGLGVEREALINLGEHPWPKDPSGCQAFGPMYPCEFENVCWNQINPPYHDDSKLVKPFSHSSASNFQRCNELYRLSRLTERGESGEDVAAKGLVFHSVMEEVFNQIIATQTVVDASI